MPGPLHPGSLADVAGLAVGHRTRGDRATGCTVVLCPQGVVCGVDVRGGAPGTRETDLLKSENTVERVHAVLLTGGSAFGLDAAGGVMRWLDERGHGLAVGPARVPIVPAAVLFDLWVGDARIRPGADDGYAACEAAATAAANPNADATPAQGPVGAGAGSNLPQLDTVPEELRPEFSREMRVRVMMGLYDHKLTEEGIKNFTEEEWTLTPVADRMGLRFDGPGAPWKDEEQPFGAGQDPSNITDAGYAVGSIQIPGGKQPIVLHCDAVSGGGYAQAGTVISADMDLFGRMAPGTKVRFVPVTMEEALAARAERQALLARVWS